MLVRNNDPFYIPNFDSGINAICGIAIKLCKLGKYFAPRFSEKYYSHITTAINFYADDYYSLLQNKQYPTDMAIAFDRSFSIANFYEKESFNFPTALLNITYNNSSENLLLSSGHFAIENIISAASEFVTLKIGDILFFGLREISDIQIGDTISLNIDGITKHICAIK